MTAADGAREERYRAALERIAAGADEGSLTLIERRMAAGLNSTSSNEPACLIARVALSTLPWHQEAAAGSEGRQ